MVNSLSVSHSLLYVFMYMYMYRVHTHKHSLILSPSLFRLFLKTQLVRVVPRSLMAVIELTLPSTCLKSKLWRQGLGMNSSLLGCLSPRRTPRWVEPCGHVILWWVGLKSHDWVPILCVHEAKVFRQVFKSVYSLL